MGKGGTHVKPTEYRFLLHRVSPNMGEVTACTDGQAETLTENIPVNGSSNLF